MAMNGGYVSEQDLDDELFGEPAQSTVDYLRERVDRYASSMSDAFNGFFSNSRDLFERYNGEGALRRIRNRVRKVANVFTSDTVRPLRTMEEMQTAKPTMQRYIMANLAARILSDSQAIDGYSDSYRNPYPGTRGLTNPDFMRVIDGIIFDEDRHGLDTNNEDNAWVAFQDTFHNPDERDLDVVEQGDILSTWDYLEALLSAKQYDPTSSLNEKM